MWLLITHMKCSFSLVFLIQTFLHMMAVVTITPFSVDPVTVYYTTSFSILLLSIFVYTTCRFSQ